MFGREIPPAGSRIPGRGHPGRGRVRISNAPARVSPSSRISILVAMWYEVGEPTGPDLNEEGRRGRRE